MASAIQRKAHFISHKLKLLKDQRDDLITAVGQCVNTIIASGESWTQGGDNNVEFQELCHMVDTVSLFLCEKCEELADLPSQFLTSAAATPGTSDRQPTAPLVSTATTSYKQPRESVQVQHADESQLKPLLSRMAVIEDAMCCFRSRAEKSAEQQRDIDQQLEELLFKLSESDTKHSSRFEKLKQQISDISVTRDSVEQEQKTRLQSVEKQLQMISTAQDRLKAWVESQADLAETLVHVPNKLESLKENVDKLDARTDGIVHDWSNRQDGIETVTRDLANKVMANTLNGQTLSEGHVKMTTMLKQLETRLQKMEADGRRNEAGVQKQIEKGESNFRILCQMLNDRLRPLEQLRTCLNERASMRDDNVIKLCQLIEEVAAMSPRLQQLEMKSSGTRCGFSAGTSLTGEMADKSILRPYATTYCNVGKHFNADSGIFTAPVDGLYVASVSLCTWDDEHVSVAVEYKQSLDQVSSTSVCMSSVATEQITACDVGVVDMKAGEVLFLRVNQKYQNGYDNEVSFSCFLLK